MGINAAQLLQALGAGIIPSGPARPGALEGATFDFAALLQRAQRGEFESGRSVRIEDGADIDLTPEQISRLNQAADAADVAGARTLFAVIDGLGVVIDVPNRSIERAVALHDGDADRVLPADVLVGVDAVAVVPDEGESGADEPVALPSSRRAAFAGELSRIENHSLLSRLASQRTDSTNVSDF